MINSMKVTSGYPIELKLELFKKKIEFKPGLNVLFGPNGCGKTSALKIMASYSGVQGKGWSTSPDPHFDDKNINYPELFKKRCKVGAEVEWDGSPSYFSTSVGEVVAPAHFDEKECIGEQIKIMQNKPSSGQLRLYHIGKMIHEKLTPKLVPDLTVADLKGVNDVWQATRQKFADYVKTLPRNGKITLLLDEPDKSLSLPVQYDLWNTGIPQWSTNLQVIVATHSPCCFLAHDANIIECVEGYIEDCKFVVQQIANKNK